MGMNEAKVLKDLLELATKYLGETGVKYYLKEHGDEEAIKFYEQEVLKK